MEFAELRSSIEQTTWPALLSGTAAQLLALQRQFDETQWWPAEQLRARQFEQLQLLLRHAAATVPFHAERLRLAGIDPNEPLTEAAWARLPILTRRDVQDAGELLRATTIPASHGGTGVSSTGGSSGIPVRVRRSELERLLWNAVRVREEIWHREDMLGTIARLRPIPDSLGEANIRQARSPEGLSLPDWGSPISLLWRTGPMALIDDGTPLSEQAERLRRLRPEYLSANPSALRILLGHCRDAGITLPNLRAVWTLSEVVDPDLRALCQDVFGVRIVHNYSAAECGYIALQCPEHPHFHIQSELALVEVLDVDGRPCGSGEIGRVIVTPLHNFAMPLLRYEIGDEAEVGEPCPCGRGLPVLTNVIGRLDDYVTLPNGERRRNNASHYRLARIPALREFQIVQCSLELIEARLAVARPLTADEEQRVRTVLLAAFGDAFRIELVYCELIPRTGAGKLRTFVSELPRD